MGLFSSPGVGRLPPTSARRPIDDVQANLLGRYIAVFNAGRDTKAIAADIKRANDLWPGTGLSMVRFQQFLLQHIEERVLPKDRARARGQVLKDFPTDGPGRALAEKYNEDLSQVQKERDRLQRRLTHVERSRLQEKEARLSVQHELKVARREAQVVIDRLDDDLSAALQRSSVADDKISAAMMALARLPESGPLPTPRSRPTSEYARAPSVRHRPPSLLFDYDSAASDGSGGVTPEIERTLSETP